MADFENFRKFARHGVCAENQFILVYEGVKSLIKINESRYIGLFMVSGSIKKLFSIINIYFYQSIVFANDYLFSIFFLIDFAQWKSLGLPHIAYIVIH